MRDLEDEYREAVKAWKNQLDNQTREMRLKEQLKSAEKEIKPEESVPQKE